MSEAHPSGVTVEALPVGPAGPRCGCVRRHVPAPYEDVGHHVVPVGQPFGGDPKGELVWLCPTGHSSVHGAIRRLLAARSGGYTAARGSSSSVYVWNLALRAVAHLDKEAP